MAKPTPTPTSTTVRNLRAAADLIEARGLAKRAHYRDGAHCTIGALEQVTDGCSLLTAEKQVLAKSILSVLNPLRWFYAGHGRTYARIAAWNDVPWRTQRGVVKKLRRTATRLERCLARQETTTHG